jgi:nicotinamidase-related amidase
VRPIEGATALVVVDVQERLAAAMPEAERPRFGKAVCNLVSLAAASGWPIVVTEQYPRGLGPTTSDVNGTLERAGSVTRLEKLCFSACEAEGFMSALQGVRVAVVVGMEAHVCVLETALGLRARGLDVLVPWDGVLSRDGRDKACALELLRAEGVVVTSSETVVFQAVGRAGTPLFKEMAPRVR